MSTDSTSMIVEVCQARSVVMGVGCADGGTAVVAAYG
jgi:hypothetical protein